MRIAYVCTDQGVPVFGTKGCSIHVQQMLLTLVRRGADVHLFARRWGSFRPAELDGVITHELPSLQSAEAARRELEALSRNQQVREALEQAGPFDIVYERYSLWSHAPMEFARDRNISSVLEVNAPLIEEQARHRTLVSRPDAEDATVRCFEAARAISTVSTEVAQWVRGRGAAPQKIHVIANGVCPRSFSPDVPPARENLLDNFTIGFVGSLRPWHGIEHLLEAFLLLHQRGVEATLLVVGDGPLRNEILTRVRSAPAEARQAIHVVGAVAPEQVPRFLTSMHVAVAPYPELESFYFSPLKVYEYMAAARPVVASRCGQLKSLIKHEHNGLHCHPGDPVSLADALERLYYDPSLRERLGQNARRTVCEQHTWDSVLDRVLTAARFKTRRRTLSLNMHK